MVIMVMTAIRDVSLILSLAIVIIMPLVMYIDDRFDKEFTFTLAIICNSLLALTFLLTLFTAS